MAQIDVTDILSDPDFVDEMTVITRVPAVNLRGENILTEQPLVSIGSVQPASGKVLQRLPESLRLANMSSFWFKGKIIASEPGKYSSILVFNGQRYEVQHVFDWSNFGEGFTEGVCVAEKQA